MKVITPSNTQFASLNIYDLNGTQIKTIVINNRNDVEITVNSNELNPGMYLYSLITDNKLVDTKTMVLTSN